MEVTALCVRLLMTVLLQLVARVDSSDSQKADAAFPRVDPNRPQFFEHESIMISCEGLQGLTGWRVMKKIKGDTRTCASIWSTSTGPCKIDTAYPDLDSGEYWCELGAKKSSTVNITVTAGSVILESPVLPVTEGDAVTLSCRNKQMSSNQTTQFFKNGYLMDSSPTGNLTIRSVSKSNEGWYTCSVSEGVSSPQSRLTVREHTPSADKERHHDPPLSLPLCIGVAALIVALLLLLLGLLRWRKHQIITTVPETPSPHPSIQAISPPLTGDQTS
ncbi:low affinity immunoglobulin gamma Fc region receptor II-a-like [Plectropomus leopardus]|uniref:low affinity immunoglobulin gamma Fc region receptor II-a-like n=1 Tax=Plectropomus leopardus TaxID=160734 RepID=UPI001C4A8AC6|nr:low affinity immunoglobulin gamma Fc region receptor II-a-like [Plectropomus leopardus]